jgi:hypothetical protein
VVLRPRRDHQPPEKERGAEVVMSPAAFRDSLTSERPTAIDVRVGDVLKRPDHWFGDLACPLVGGAMALLSVSGASRHSERIDCAIPPRWVWCSSLRSTPSQRMSAPGGSPRVFYGALAPGECRLSGHRARREGRHGMRHTGLDAPT